MRRVNQAKRDLSIQIPAALLTGLHNCPSSGNNLILRVEITKDEISIIPEGYFDVSTLTKCLDELLGVRQTRCILHLDLSRIPKFDNRLLAMVMSTLKKYSKDFQTIKVSGMDRQLCDFTPQNQSNSLQVH